MAANTLHKLRQLVSQGHLQITHILAPPRTMSTILEVALSQAVHSQIHEPFRKITKRKNTQRGFETILLRVEELRQMHAGPIQIVIKDISEFTPEEWATWMPMVQNFVFVVREPHLQTRSLIKLSVIQALSSKTLSELVRILRLGILHERSLGRLFLARQQALEFLRLKFTGAVKTEEERIQDALPHIESGILSLNRGTYRLLLHYLQAVEEHLLDSPHKKLVIVDGLGLKMEPAITLGRIADRFGWGNLAVLGWSKSVGGLFYDRDADGGDNKQRAIKNSWNRRAVSSTRIDKIDVLQDAPAPLAWFPTSIQELICSDLLPIYMQFLMHPSVVSLPSQDQLTSPLQGLTGKVTLGDINPVAAYAAAAVLNIRAEVIGSQEALDELRLRLRGRFVEWHGQAFDIIDQAVKESSKVK